MKLSPNKKPTNSAETANTVYLDNPWEKVAQITEQETVVEQNENNTKAVENYVGNNPAGMKNGTYNDESHIGEVHKRQSENLYTDVKLAPRIELTNDEYEKRVLQGGSLMEIDLNVYGLDKYIDSSDQLTNPDQPTTIVLEANMLTDENKTVVESVAKRPKMLDGVTNTERLTYRDGTTVAIGKTGTDPYTGISNTNVTLDSLSVGSAVSIIVSQTRERDKAKGKTHDYDHYANLADELTAQIKKDRELKEAELKGLSDTNKKLSETPQNKVKTIKETKTTAEAVVNDSENKESLRKTLALGLGKMAVMFAEKVTELKDQAKDKLKTTATNLATTEVSADIDPSVVYNLKANGITGSQLDQALAEKVQNKQEKVVRVKRGIGKLALGLLSGASASKEKISRTKDTLKNKTANVKQYSSNLKKAVEAGKSAAKDSLEASRQNS